jgi:RNA recognition motif-containing protein
MQKKLYVGNLSFETTESDLKELFGQAGAVETVRIITDRDTGRSKGFGFVEMQDGGDKAIAEMNGKDFKGRALLVNEARPMSSKDSRGGGFKGSPLRRRGRRTEGLRHLRFLRTVPMCSSTIPHSDRWRTLGAAPCSSMSFNPAAREPPAACIPSFQGTS